MNIEALALYERIIQGRDDIIEELQTLIVYQQDLITQLNDEIKDLQNDKTNRL